MKVTAMIQARMGSTRLPGKVLKTVHENRTLLEVVIDQISHCCKLDEIVVLTTVDDSDKPVVELCQALGVPVFTGSVDDVLDRYYQAGLVYRPDHIVRITADCPLIDPQIVDEVICLHLEHHNDYTSNRIRPTWPDGLDTEVMTWAALEKTWQQAEKKSEREHVTPYIYNNPNQFQIENFPCHQDISSHRWTVDAIQDLDFIQRIYTALAKTDGYIRYDQVLRLLQKNPDWLKINSDILRDEGYGQSLGQDDDYRGQELYIKAKKIIPGGTQLFSKRPELFLPHQWPPYYSWAKGCRICDLDGRKYIDTSYMGIGSCILGYADSDVDDAVRQAIDNGNMSTLNAPEEVELAELLLDIHPWAQNVRYARTGGEAVTQAVRVARAATGKDVILFCGYHGWHDWYLAANLSDQIALDGHLMPGLQPAGVPRALHKTAFPFRYNDLECFQSLLAEHDGLIAAVVIEPIRNIQPQNNFLQKIRELTSKKSIPLIADEISAGWRSNIGGSHLELNLEPDICVFAKGMSNGYPMAAIIGKESVMDAYQKSFISSTYWTDRLGPAAAIATIRKIRSMNVPQKLKESGMRVKKNWKEAAASFNIKLEISGIDPMGHFEFADGDKAALKTLFTKCMLEKGFLATNAFYASYAHDDHVLDTHADAVYHSFGQIRKAMDSGNVESQIGGPVCQSGFARLT